MIGYIKVQIKGLIKVQIIKYSIHIIFNRHKYLQ